MVEDARQAGAPESAEPEAESGAEAVTAPIDASAAAVAMQAARADAGLAAKAGAYFDRQAALVAIQTEHMHEQRGVALSLLKLKRVVERFRIVSQLFFGIIAGLVVAYLLIMVNDALVTRAVIVEPFDTPPALAEAGLSGRVVAGALLDRLTTLQMATQSTAAKRDLANSWSGDIKVEVPETGLSLGDIDRLLKARFGSDIHIGGDLVRGAGGALELTVRGDGVMPKSFSGDAAALKQLISQAGEYVYGQTQPALFAVYLLRAGRNREAIAFSKAAVTTAPVEDRPYLLNAWAGALGNSGGSLRQALALERAAIALKPDYATAYANAALYARNLGDEEGAWQLGQSMRHAVGTRAGSADDLSFAVLDYLTFDLLTLRTALLADAEHHAGIGSTTGSANPQIAGIDADLHDIEGARQRLDLLDLSEPYAAAVAHYVRSRIAEADGDKDTAVREIEAYEAANADPAVSGGDTSYHCFVAPVEEASGHLARADAALAAGGHFVDCARWRADGLDHRGDWAGAQRAYAAAVAMAPDLPAAYESWGEALLRHGDLDGAIDKLAASHARGPHWADPLKAWGDVLARQGKAALAQEKYDMALVEAPAWVALRRAARK